MSIQMKNKLQIGVIGSMADRKLGEKVKKFADEIGKSIADRDAVLLFGFEGDFDSVSFIAARSAEENNGNTIAFIWGKDKQDLQGLHSTKIVTGQHRGGGREFPFILSCDVIISIGGGSGTLMEIAMACQAGIPVIALEKSGGWSQRLAGKFLDNRKRIRIQRAHSVKETVDLAFKRDNKT